MPSSRRHFPAPRSAALALRLALVWGALGAGANVGAVPLDPPVVRELTSATGEKLHARIVDVTETQVTIVRLEDRARLVFPIERLSAEDRGYVAALYQINKDRSPNRPVTTAPTAVSSATRTVSGARPTFTQATNLLTREQDATKLREAIEVVISDRPEQPGRGYPLHYASYYLWRACRRLPDRQEAERWVDELLTTKLADRSLSASQREAFVFMTLTRHSPVMFSPAWRSVVDEFAKVHPTSAHLAAMEVGYAGARYRADKDEAKRHLHALLASANPGVAEAAKGQLAEWAETEALGPIQTWRFTAIDGREVDFAKMRGKVVLVDFWATWCGPCVKEFPMLRKLYADNHHRGLEIVGIALEYDRPTKEAALEKLREYVKVRELPWPHYSDASGWKTKYALAQNVRGIPRMVLIDRDGTVIAGSLRGDALAERVEQLLDDPASR